MQQSIQPIFNQSPSLNLYLSIIIPCYDELRILDTLNSLFMCIPGSHDVEILIVVNDGTNDPLDLKNRNIETKKIVVRWIQSHIRDDHQYFILDYTDVPEKFSGVGSARKYGMDIAFERQDAIGLDGVIANLDADCLVSLDYCSTIIRSFKQDVKLYGASLYYAHRFDVPENEAAIVDYELHLRLYNQALRHAGFPLAFQTVGSSMACRSSAYRRQGGMNRRKAGEDFYFIQKLMKLGHYQDINDLCVYPSSRTSSRVPFGTGKAMADYHKKVLDTYALSNYACLKRLIQGLPQLYQANYSKWAKQLSPTFKIIYDESNINSIIGDSAKNSKNYLSFRKRFFANFDGFKVMKMIHFGRDNFWPNEGLNKVANEFLQNLEILTNLELLKKYRKMEKRHPLYLEPDFSVEPLG